MLCMINITHNIVCFRSTNSQLGTHGLENLIEANTLKPSTILFVLLLTHFLMPSVGLAENLLSTVAVGDYLTVEQNIALMDKDKNGFADVFEVRAYLEKMHGEGYEKEELDFLVSTAKGKSCSTPFSKALY